MFARIDKAVANWDPQRRQVIRAQSGRAFIALYNSGQLDAGIAAAEQLVKKQIGAGRREPFRYRVGARHAGDRIDARAARCRRDPGVQGRHSGPDGERARERRRRGHDRGGRAQPAAADHRRELSRSCSRGPRIPAAASARRLSAWRMRSAAARCSRRWRPPARARAAKDPALAELVRKEQDLTKQVNAQLGTLNNVLAHSLGGARREGRAGRSRPRSQRCAANATRRAQEIKQKFPGLCRSGLAEAAERRPDQGDAGRRRGDAVVLFRPARQLRLGGAEERARWRSPRSTPACGDIESKVRKLREALEPQAAMISDIPPFDLKLGYELYALLLKPVESGLEAGQEPDRGHQRRARPVAAVAAADRAGGGRQPMTIRCLSSYRERAVAGADPCRHDGAVGRGAAHAAAVAAGQARPRRADRVRRSLFQQGAGKPRPKRADAQGAGGRCRRQRHARHAAEAPQQPEARRRRQRRTRRCCRGFPTPPTN